MSMCALVLCLGLGLQQAAPPAVGRPSVAIAVQYPAVAEVEQMRQHFAQLKTAGFNAIATSITWRDGEPSRGGYNLLNVDRLVAVATENGLRVSIAVYAEPEPAWKTDGTNALAGDFYEYVRRRFAANPVVLEVARALRPSESDRDRVLVGSNPPAVTPRQARLAFWSAIASGGRRIEFVDSDGLVSSTLRLLSDTVGVVTRNQALFGALVPRKMDPADVTFTGERGRVTVQILESSEALVIVATNHAPEVRRVKMTFKPDIPEAIWQNMEEGLAVQFVMSTQGPVLEHTFAPDDVLVLAIRKKLR
jgi:glycosyl hydrolase family 42 (putative beta-galactosidase)